MARFKGKTRIAVAQFFTLFCRPCIVLSWLLFLKEKKWKNGGPGGRQQAVHEMAKKKVEMI